MSELLEHVTRNRAYWDDLARQHIEAGVFEAEDFGPALTPELREQEGRLRAELEQRNAS